MQHYVTIYKVQRDSRTHLCTLTGTRQTIVFTPSFNLEWSLWIFDGCTPFTIDRQWKQKKRKKQKLRIQTYIWYLPDRGRIDADNGSNASSKFKRVNERTLNCLSGVDAFAQYIFFGIIQLHYALPAKIYASFSRNCMCQHLLFKNCLNEVVKLKRSYMTFACFACLCTANCS